MNTKSTIWSTGLAMFSMFFGAGNIVFPLALGQFTGDYTLYGILGLVLTAIFIPLGGLMAMLCFEGDYHAFFRRVGRFPGFILILLILGLLGPLGGIPRCITISYATLEGCLGSLGRGGLPIFSLFSCVVIYLFTYRPNKILPLLGYVLTPILLGALAIIIVRGVYLMPSLHLADHTRWETFSYGIVNGYNTMDLMAAFFFSSAVLLCLRAEKGEESRKTLLRTVIWSSLLAASLLAIIYVSFAYLAAGFQGELAHVPTHQLLGVLARQLLGMHAGLLAGIVAAFACLTTEIALTAVFAEFLHKVLSRGKLSYQAALGYTLGASFLMSTLHFTGLSAFLAPILQVCYPALIVLTVLNLLHKVYGFQPVKRIFYGALGATLLLYLLY